MANLLHRTPLNICSLVRECECLAGIENSMCGVRDIARVYRVLLELVSAFHQLIGSCSSAQYLRELMAISHYVHVALERFWNRARIDGLSLGTR